jgi:signal transduction histidine kinase
VFAIAVVVVVGAMSWVTDELLGFEGAQREARAEAAHEETMRLALWRMDSWLSTELAVESSAWVDVTISGTVLRRTKLVGRYVHVGEDAEFDDEMSALRDWRELVKRIDRALARLGSTIPRPVGEKDVAGAPSDRNLAEFQQRALNNYVGQNGGAPIRGVVSNDLRRSILVPMWVRQGDAGLLIFLRHDISHFGASGFIVDWEFVERSLTDLVKDLVPAATLRPLTDDEVECGGSGFVMASAPIALVAPAPPAPPIPLTTPTRVSLAVAWAAILASIAAFGVALKRTTDLSDRRSRFASSVTHELRTPLTTFRLYSEMLADGMVTDAAQRQGYLDTLKSESARLATLVENVLAFSRVEEGRMPVRRERIAVADLLQRVTPQLDRRAKDAGASLSVDAGSAAHRVVDADPDVVGQILFNLVDNAAKYAPGAPVELTAETRGGAVRLAVRDHGPGLAADRVRAAFTPFERAGRPPGDAVPGIGLGLALSRALARDLGGDLVHETPAGGGAAFVLTLPCVASAS